MTLQLPTATTPRLLSAVGSPAVRGLLQDAPQPADVLGVYPTAVYLRRAGQVIAVLTQDAVHLPLGLVLAVDSTRQPLDRWSGQVLVGRGGVQTTAWRVRMSRTVSTAAPIDLRPDPEVVAYAETWLQRRAELLRDADDLALAARRCDATTSADAVHGLLGVGPGLTPAGDDVLAGFLVAARSFGLQADHVRTAVLATAPSRTTSLSAALLTCAARGEAIPQATALLRAIDAGRATPSPGEALRSLAGVGHTSGVAMALGVVTAARAVVDRAGRPDSVPREH